MTDAPVILVTRIVAYAAAVAGAISYIPVLTGSFEAGIWPLLSWYFVAGAAIGSRAMPVGRELDHMEGGLDPVVKPRIRPSLIDLAVVIGISIVGGFLVVFISGRFYQWSWPLLMLLLLGMAIAFGLLVGILIVTPLGMLGGAIVRALQGKRVAGYAVGLALLLLTVVAFGIVGATAVEGHSRSHVFLVGAYQGIFVVLTGIPIDDMHVGSQPLAWIARALAAVLVIEVGLLWWLRTFRPAPPVES